MEIRIERYLTGKMDAVEKDAFEQEMANDSILRKKVNGSKWALKAIRLDGRSKLKNRLTNLDNVNANSGINKKKEGFSSRYLVLLGGILIIVLFFIFRTNNELKPTETPTNTESEIKETIELKKEETSNLPEKITIPDPPDLIPTPKKKTTKPSVKKEIPIAKTKPKTPNNQVLFAQNFEAYQHPSMRPNVRGQGDLSTREQFELAYWEKDFAKVLTLWNELSETQKKNGNLLFLKAVSLMSNGKVLEAKIDFEQLLNIKRHRFKQQSEWYLALAALHENDKAKAKNILIQITENSSHKFYQLAVDLLKSIENK